MKHKFLVWIIPIGIIVILLMMFFNEPKKINRKIISNFSHDQNDIDEVMEFAIEKMSIYHIKITDIQYDEEKYKEIELALMKEHNDAVESVVITMNFQTEFFLSDVDLGFGANQTYKDYELHFIKNESNAWIQVGSGYS